LKPLIDADVIRYEAGFACEAAWGQEGPPPWSWAETKVTSLIDHICDRVSATTPPKLFFTGKTNFRHEIATVTPYKQRSGVKPYHYKNLTAFLKSNYEWEEVEGFEADDLMSIEQTANEKRNGKNSDKHDFVPTIICTRDKDLRSVSGWHYGWELSNQPEYGPAFHDGVGELRLSSNRKSLKGSGLVFFLSQCLTGDVTDSIPGLPKCGPVAAYSVLEPYLGGSYEDALEAVYKEYERVYGGDAYNRLLEQGRLLWMTREVDSNGKPVLWEFTPRKGVSSE
jgi:5'-3' exonuclease